MKSPQKQEYKMSKYDIKVTGVAGGTVEKSNVAGVVHGGMGNSVTTTHNQGSRQITNQGNIGNIATGDNHSGSMAASVGGQPGAGGTRDPKALTPGEVINLLRERHCTEDTIKSFETHIVDGRLFMDLDDELLADLEIKSRIEQRKLKLLKEDLIQ